MKKEAFVGVLENYKALSDKKVSTFVLLELEVQKQSYQEIDRLLANKIRANDIVGVAENGNLQILLSQATEKDLQFILPRFEGMDITVKVLSK